MKKEWNAEKRSYEKTAIMLTGKTIRVKDVEKGMADQIGYTSAKGSIHLAYDHPIMDGLNKLEKAAFRKGVFAHETLHQIFTDFKALESLLKSVDPYEKNILGVIFNILEDPAIENYASTVIGGNLLNCLKFSIAHTYSKSSEIDKSETAMGQYIAALVHFGDMGLIKGKFTFPEAKSCFSKTANLFYKGINEPVGKKRLDIAKEIFEISRPLWQKEVDQAKMIDELLKQMGAEMRGSGSGQDGDPDALPESDKKDKRRKITIEKISKEEYEEMKNNSSESSSELPPDGDITVYVCDEADDEDENGNGSNSSSIPVSQEGEKSDSKENSSSENSSGSGNKTEENSENKNSSSGSSKKEETTDEESSENKKSGKNSEKNSEENSDSENESSKSSDENSDDKSNEDSNKNSGDKSNKESDEKTDNNSDEDTDNDSDEKTDEKADKESEKKSDEAKEINNSDSSNQNSFRSEEKSYDIKIKSDGEESDYDNEDATIDDEEYILSQDDISYIKKEQEKEIKEYEEEVREESSDSSPLDDFPISSSALGRRSCLNYRVSFKESDVPRLEAAYETVLSELNPGIKNLTNQLKKIFQNDMEEKLYKGTGKINIDRMNNGRLTSRVFNKKSSPNEKSDLAIFLLIDESGSMGWNNKYLAARKAAIALAEVCNSLNIPVYIMGFTADTQGYDVVHNHYVTWKNSTSDRLKLLNISSRANNCDGYSIRYATQIMKKSKAKHKLMMVLSDGQPAAHSYNNGIADTKDAIKEAKKTASVLGVAIGNNDTNTIHYMYENDFLHISNVNELFFGLARKIKTIIRSWD